MQQHMDAHTHRKHTHKSHTVVSQWSAHGMGGAPSDMFAKREVGALESVCTSTMSCLVYSDLMPSK